MTLKDHYFCYILYECRSFSSVYFLLTLTTDSSEKEITPNLCYFFKQFVFKVKLGRYIYNREREGERDLPSNYIKYSPTGKKCQKN